MMDALSQISYSSDDEDTKESPSNDFLQDFFFLFSFGVEKDNSLN